VIHFNGSKKGRWIVAEEIDYEKKYPIRNWLLKLAIVGGVAYLVVSPFLQPKLRDMIPPEQLQRIEQQMQQDKQYQQYRSEMPGVPTYAGEVEGIEGAEGAEGIEGMELDSVKVAQGMDLLFKRDDYFLQRLEALERRVQQLQQRPAYQDRMPD
jgi:hypothetical protein